MNRHRYLVALAICTLPLFEVVRAHGASQIDADAKADSAANIAATTAAAAKVIDLRTFPQIPGATSRRRPVLASISYEAPGTVQNGFAFIQKELVAQEWTELPGGYMTDRSANGTFERRDAVCGLGSPAQCGRSRLRARAGTEGRRCR